MTALIVCWIVFPALLGLIAQGLGTVVERLAGLRITLGVRIPCGVALLIAVMDLVTRSSSAAHRAVPAVVVLAAIGLALSRPWRWRAPGPVLLTGVIVFAVYAAPVVMSGMATWTGYIKLDDTATWLAIVDRTLSHGHSLAGLPPSTYRATLHDYLGTGYPVGSFLPLGLGHALLGEDNAWLVNPWMAFLAATLALALHRIASLAQGEHAGAWRAVLVAALAAQPALLYGYYLWGGVKEVTAATLIAAFAVAAPLALQGSSRLRKMIPAAVVLWALLAALSPGGLVYAAPGLALALLLWGSVSLVRRSRADLGPGAGGVGRGASEAAAAEAPPPLVARSRLRLRRTWAIWLVPVAAAGLGAYLVLRPGGYVAHFESTLTGEGELGNLIRPLSLQQLAGIWPVEDFRFPPDAPAVTHALVALAALFAVVGFVLALRHGRRELVLYVLCALGGAAIVDPLGSPWLAGKALASASPAVPLAALTALLWPGLSWQRTIAKLAHRLGGPADGAALGGSELPFPAEPKPVLQTATSPLSLAATSSLLHLGRGRAAADATDAPVRGGAATGRCVGAGARRAWSGLAALGACVIGAGIVWSNLLAYHDVSLAPRTQFQELAEIGTRIAGQGPTLMTEFQPYGTHHFLREAAPEGISDLRTRRVPLISGAVLEPGATTDIDQIKVRAVLVYRTLVLQRSPVASRPPSPYGLIIADRFWEVWKRPPKSSAPVLWQLPLGGATRPGGVPDCRTLTRLARRPGVKRLVAEPVENPLVVALADSAHPAGWSMAGPWLAPAGSGTARLAVRVPRAGRYSVWLGGSTRGPLSVSVDGRSVGQALEEIQEAGQYLPFDQISLSSGTHTVELHYGGGLWQPGVGGAAEPVGPLVLRRETVSDGQAVARAPLLSLSARRAPALCGRTLDWVEGMG